MSDTKPPPAPITITHDRRKVDRALQDLENRMTERAVVVNEMRVTLIENVADVKAIKKQLAENSSDTKEVLDILHAGKGFFKVVGWFGGIAKWVTLVGAPVITFWYALKGGGK